MNERGRFIVFEGVDGSGKSTCIDSILEFLRERDIECQLAREPGSSLLGERLRELLLYGEADLISNNKTEILLFYAARVENIPNIKALLQKGVWVIMDRFNDSSFAYQSFDQSIDDESIAAIDKICLGDFAPDLVILLDIDAEDVVQRLCSQEQGSGQGRADRFHKRGQAQYRHLVEIYRQRALDYPDNHVVVDARLSPEEVAHQAKKVIAHRFFNHD